MNLNQTTMKSLKPIFSAIFLFAFCASVFAQSINKQKLDSIITIGENTKVEYFYNEKGNNTSLIGYAYSSTIMAYEAKYKREFSFNELKQITSDQYFTWDKSLNQWITENRTDKGYDENGQLSLSNYYEWNKTENKWEFLRKTDFTNTYDSGNKQILVINSFTTNKGSTDIIKRKWDFVYTSSYLKITLSNWESNKWIESRIEYYTYDINHNIGNYAGGGIGFEIKYNNNFTYDQLLVPSVYFPNYCMLPSRFDFKHLVTSMEEQFTAWKRNYYYSSMILTGIDEQVSSNFTIFPNPTTEFLNIQWSSNHQELEMDLYCLSGVRIMTKRIENNSKVSLQGFSKGMYLLTLKGNDGILHNGKIILK